MVITSFYTGGSLVGGARTRLINAVVIVTLLYLKMIVYFARVAAQNGG